MAALLLGVLAGGLFIWAPWDTDGDPQPSVGPSTSVSVSGSEVSASPTSSPVEPTDDPLGSVTAQPSPDPDNTAGTSPDSTTAPATTPPPTTPPGSTTGPATTPPPTTPPGTTPQSPPTGSTEQPPPLTASPSPPSPSPPAPPAPGSSFPAPTILDSQVTLAGRAAALGYFSMRPEAGRLMGLDADEAVDGAARNRERVVDAAPFPSGPRPSACLDEALAGARPAIVVAVETVVYNGQSALAYLVVRGTPQTNRADLLIAAPGDCATLLSRAVDTPIEK